MLKKISLISLLLFFVINGFAQGKLNQYKYVIIPKSYSFLGEDNKYQLNALTKFLFDKQGFKTVWQDEDYPADLENDPCLGLRVDVKNNSNMFTSKLVIDLIDCRNQVVFQTAEGKSKEKEFKKSYQEALRKAFISIEREHYRYEPQSKKVAPVVAAVPAKPEPANEQKGINPAPKPEKPVRAEKPAKPAVANDIARSYRGEGISFFLIAQETGYAMYINDSKDPAFKKGEKIGVLYKTSLPNVYRVNWKTKSGAYEDSTAYFDESGNLKIDVKENGKIVAKEFKVEK